MNYLEHIKSTKSDDSNESNRFIIRLPIDNLFTNNLFTNDNPKTIFSGFAKEQDNNIKTRFIDACRSGYNDEQLVDLLTNLFTTYPQDFQKEINYALCTAIRYKQFNVVLFLLDNGAEVHHSNNLPIKTAIRIGNTQIVKILVERGADIHTDDDRLLLLCCQSGDFDSVLKILIDSGIEVLKHYWTALSTCFDKTHAKSATILIEYSIANPINKIIVDHDEADELNEPYEPIEIDPDCTFECNNALND